MSKVDVVKQVCAPASSASSLVPPDSGVTPESAVRETSDWGSAGGVAVDNRAPARAGLEKTTDTAREKSPTGSLMESRQRQAGENAEPVEKRSSEFALGNSDAAETSGSVPTVAMSIARPVAPRLVELNFVACASNREHQERSHHTIYKDVSCRNQSCSRPKRSEEVSAPLKDTATDNANVDRCRERCSASSIDREHTPSDSRKTDSVEWRRQPSVRHRSPESPDSGARSSESKTKRCSLTIRSQKGLYCSPPLPIGAFVELPNMRTVSRCRTVENSYPLRRTHPASNGASTWMDSPNPSRKRGRGVVQRSNPEEQESSMKLVIIQPEDVSEHFVDSCETLIHDIDSSFSSTELDSEVDPWLVVASLPPRENIPLIPAAYLPDPEPKMRHRPTLVLDLDETLVHCSTEFLPRADFEFGVHFQDTDYNIYVKCRPHLNAFLKYASTYFEVVIFTASQKAYADRLLNILDPENNFIHHRLFRDACVYVAGNYLKDLSVLNRDLRRTVIVDNSPQAFGYHVENGIPILTWIDDENDCELVQLVLLLEVLRKEADHEDADVRSVVERRFRNTNRVAFYRAFLSSLEHS